MRQISRDPFARETLMRESVRVSLAAGGCAWCGGKRPLRAGDDYMLYRYHVETDGGRKHAAAGGKLFCSVDCLRTYGGRR
jgi:hypothetical protein